MSRSQQVLEIPLAARDGIGSADRAPTALRTLFLCGGGTGGHLMPGIALVKAALGRFPELAVTFFRTRRPVEDLVFARAGLPVEVRELNLPPPSRSPLPAARFALRAIRAAAEVRAAARRNRPDVIVALGGYPSVPGILAARREGIPLVLLEQNRAPGKVVKLFARWAAAVACPDAVAAGRLRTGSRTVVEACGNPVRRSVVLAALSRAERRAAESDGPSRTVLVAGGSQGARGINRAVGAALPALRRFRGKVSWIHIAGSADREAVAAAYREEGWEARVFDFTSDLPALLGEADFAITRSGGTTVAELAAIGVPSVLVPYPHHRDRHQLRNAEPLLEAGGALLVDEKDLGPESLSLMFDEVLFVGPRLRAMEEAALAVGRPRAAQEVLDLLIRAAGMGRKAGGS